MLDSIARLTGFLGRRSLVPEGRGDVSGVTVSSWL